MNDVVWVAIAGFLASIVDGALGMGFGPTSSSILLSSGISPAAASTTVNLAKVFTGLAAGASHWRLRNIDRGVVLRLAIPGALGAIIGTTILSNVDGKQIRPYLAILLILVGIRILFRFSRSLPQRGDDESETPMSEGEAFHDRGTIVAGAAGGVTNGLIGAWGPVVTPYLLHRGLSPRLTVGSVNTAEVAVAVVASGSLFASGTDGLRWTIIAAMLIGGVIAAPLAAYVVRFFPPRLMGLAVAGLLLLTQARELATTKDFPGSRWMAYVGIPALVIAAAWRPRIERRLRRRRRARAAASS